jgi:hypothetical protein
MLKTIRNKWDNCYELRQTLYDCAIYSTHIYLPNPGFNVTAVLTLGGFALMGVSALLAQVGYGVPDPLIMEVGRAAFYSGLGRAYTQAENKNGNGSH